MLDAERAAIEQLRDLREIRSSQCPSIIETSLTTTSTVATAR